MSLQSPEFRRITPGSHSDLPEPSRTMETHTKKNLQVSLFSAAVYHTSHLARSPGHVAAREVDTGNYPRKWYLAFASRVFFFLV